MIDRDTVTAASTTVNGVDARPISSQADLYDMSGPSGPSYAVRSLYFEAYVPGCTAVAGDSVEVVWQGRRGLAVIERITYPTREGMHSEPLLCMRAIGGWANDRWDG